MCRMSCEDYQSNGFGLTSYCTICCLKRREYKKRMDAPKRPNAKPTTVKDAETMTEAVPSTEETENFAATKAAEAHLKVEEPKASATAVEHAEEAAEATLKTKEEKAEKSTVNRAEETRPKAKTDEGAAAKEIGAVTRSAAKAKAERWPTKRP